MTVESISFLRLWKSLPNDLNPERQDSAIIHLFHSPMSKTVAVASRYLDSDHNQSVSLLVVIADRDSGDHT